MSTHDALEMCDFCGKSQKEVRKLVAGPQVHICDGCIGLALDVCREDHVVPNDHGSRGGSVHGIGLLDAGEMSASLSDVGVVMDRHELTALASMGFVPSVVQRWNGVTKYNPRAVIEWAEKNLQRNPGRDLTRVIPLPASDESPPKPGSVPSSLSHLQQRLRSVRIADCGIYFLVRDNAVVYVGQSTSVQSRVQSHRADSNKIWDYALWLPLPKDALDDVEAELIHVLQPEYNASTPPRPPSERVKEFGIATDREGTA